MKNCAHCGKTNPDDALQCPDCGRKEFNPLAAATSVEWHYALGQEQHGPITEPTLIEKVRAGQLDRNTKIWREGLPKWILLGNSDFTKLLPNGKPPPINEVEGMVLPSKTRASTTATIAPDDIQSSTLTISGVQQYKIYENGLGAREAVKQGWSWPAFFFTFIWAFVKKMNGLGGAVFGGYLFLGVLFGTLENSLYDGPAATIRGLFGLFEIGMLVVFGANGNRWRERSLAARGYQVKGMVSAATDESALVLYVKQLPQPVPAA